MSETKRRRGRPKGSGIDDNARLLQVAALLRDDPDLKPTTAIRALGVKDPSAIRRLRDKFNAARGQLTKSPGAPLPSAAPVPIHGVRAESAPRTRAARHLAPVRRSVPALPQVAPIQRLASAVSPAAPEQRIALREPEFVPPREELPFFSALRTREFQEGSAWVTAWCGLGLQAVTSAVAAQVEFTKHVVRLPPMTAALRHHLALSELAFALYASGARAAAAR